jgi:DNA mismatch endonuclease (patch repair protein)
LQPLAKLVLWQEMSDVFTKAKRSAVMSLIRGRGNKDTELRLIAIFSEHRISGWRRLHRLHGRPDFVFPREKLVVFVDGCFWHGCPKHATWPTANGRKVRLALVKTSDISCHKTSFASGRKCPTFTLHFIYTG